LEFFYFFKRDAKSITSIYKKKEVQDKIKGIRPKPSQKEINLKLNIPNIFLMYSLLIKSGIVSDQNIYTYNKVKP